MREYHHKLGKRFITRGMQGPAWSRYGTHKTLASTSTLHATHMLQHPKHAVHTWSAHML